MSKFYKISGNPQGFEHLDVFHKLAQQFLPYAQEKLQFDKPVDVQLMSDPQNAKDPLGKTAYYDPNNMKITLFVDNRHVKDIMRSLAHELVHHKQNCRGDFDGGVDTSPGYAQEDGKMRKLEGEAYLEGSGYLFRDWEDTLKKENKQMKEGKSIFAPNHYCVHHGGVYMEGEIKLGRVINHNWSESLQKVTKYDMEFEDGTILENIKAEDILVTEASVAEEHMGHAAKRDEELKEKKKGKYDDGDGEDEKCDHVPCNEEVVDEGKDKPCPKCKKVKCETHCGGVKEAGPTPHPVKKDEKEKTNENWFKGDKDQVLFETLMKKWAK